MDQHIIISVCLALAGAGIGWMLAQLRAGHQAASFLTERRLLEEAQQRQQHAFILNIDRPAFAYRRQQLL